MKLIFWLPVIFAVCAVGHVLGMELDKWEQRARHSRGRAAYYGEGYRGKRMANGERFDPDARTCASFDYPLGTVLRVRSVRTGRAVNVTVTDRGPARYLKRTIDLSERAFQDIAPTAWGVIAVEIEILAPANAETQ